MPSFLDGKGLYRVKKIESHYSRFFFHGSPNFPLPGVGRSVNVSLDGMQIDVLFRYDPHTLSLGPFKFFFPIASLTFITATKLFHQVIREKTKHKASTALHP